MILQKLIYSKHLEGGEKILYAIHKHWIVLVKSVLEFLFFGVAVPWELYLIGFNKPVFLWIIIGWTIFAFIRLCVLMVDWYANAWLVTNKCLLRIDYAGFFENTAGRAGFEDIESVGYEIKGLWGTLFRYGDLVVSLMSGNSMVFHHTANPLKAELEIGKHQGQYMSEREVRDAGHLKAMLSEMVSTHMRHRLK